MLSTPSDLIQWARLLFQTNQALPEKQLDLLKTRLICIDDNNPSLYAKQIQEASESCNAAFGMGIMQNYSKETGLVWIYTGYTPGVSAGYLLFQNSNIVVAYQFSGYVPDPTDLYIQVFNALGLGKII